MKSIIWAFKNMVRAAVFFTLFAFALNNQADVTVHFFFGRQWTAPMVLVVLAAFACGLVLGILAMVPRWWRRRAAERKALVSATPTTSNTTPATLRANTPVVPVTQADEPPHGI